EPGERQERDGTPPARPRLGAAPLRGGVGGREAPRPAPAEALPRPRVIAGGAERRRCVGARRGRLVQCPSTRAAAPTADDRGDQRRTCRSRLAGAAVERRQRTCHARAVCASSTGRAEARCGQARGSAQAPGRSGRMSETLAAGRYRIERELGHGGMATVYLAHDAELERPVAVKLLAEHLADDEDFHARFVREARLAGRLSHPNVVRVYDAGEADGRPFIVMEYVSGNSLAEAGRRPPPPR